MSHRLLLAVLHADNNAPISAGHLVMLDSAVRVVLSRLSLSLQYRFDKPMQSSAICEMHKSACLS
jgi:hypothetical protein